MKTLAQLFLEISNDDSIARIGDAEIINIVPSQEFRTMTIDVRFDSFVPPAAIHEAENKIKEVYDLSTLEIVPHYPKESFSTAVLNDLIEEMRRRISTVNGSFYNCSWNYDSSTGIVTAFLVTDSIMLLQAKNFEEKFERLVSDYFGISIKLSLKKGEEQELPKLPKPAPVKHEEAPAAPSAKPAPAPKTERTLPRKRYAPIPAENLLNGLPPKIKAPTVIYGKVSNSPAITLSKVSPEQHEMTVWGRVFDLSKQLTKAGTSYIVKFSITDLTSSNTVKFFMHEKDEEKCKDLADGAVVIVQGEYSFDTYDRSYVIMARCIAIATEKQRKDEAEEKRVELHLHTNMSSLDGMSPAAALIGRAAAWGHKAIAITDHGVVQAFPDAMNAYVDIYSKAKKKAKDAGEDVSDFKAPIKIIYGVEDYFIDDRIRIAPEDCELETEKIIIALRVKTTGCNAINNRIYEIAAVKISSFEITDSFNTLVKCEHDIPKSVTEQTGVKQEMLMSAPSEAEALKALFDFCGDNCVFAVHDERSDIRFIENACKRNAIVHQHYVIDTQALSRALYNEVKNYKLESVASAMKISYNGSKRAADEASLLAKIASTQLRTLFDGHGVKKVSQINSAFKDLPAKAFPSYHQIILAKNQTGLKNLYKLVSQAHINDYYRRPRTRRSMIVEHREGLIVGSACEAGELYRAIHAGADDKELEEIAMFYDYLEIQPIGNDMFMVRNGEVADETVLQDYNRKICELGEKLHKPVVATCDVHFLEPEDEVFRRVLMASFSDGDQQAPLFLRTTDEMLAEFEYLGEDKAKEVVVTNTSLIADLVEDFRPLPEGVFPPRIEGSDDNLRNITRTKAREVYGDPLPEYVNARLERELDSIIKHGFSIMYMTAQMLVADSVAHGYLVGSRGSVGSSFVATMAGISEVNPLAPHYVCPKCKWSQFFENDPNIGSGFDLPAKDCPQCGTPLNRDGHEIPFETFLGFDGDKQPDIDLNFSGEYQACAHKYTEEIFGTENVFKAGTIGTVADKTAYGYVLKYAEERSLTLPQAEMNRLSIGCTGIKRTTSQHPGGMVVVPRTQEIYDFCPIQHPADKDTADIITTHFDFHFIHYTILKLDILGHDVPTIYRYLEEYTGIPVMEVTMSDPEVMSLFTSTKALGVEPEDIGSETGTFSLPEVGTSFVRQMLIDTQPKTFTDLLQIAGLSHGTDVYLGNAKDLIADGTCTISEVIGTRDSIMTYLLQKGVPKKLSFKIMEIVRKGKSKKLLTDEMVQTMKDHDVPQWYIDSCFKIKYMFPKAHAAAYMIATLRLGWYKVHKPVEYYAAYLTARHEDFDAATVSRGHAAVRERMKEIEDKGKSAPAKEQAQYQTFQIVNEALARGVVFLPVHIYNSDADKFLVENGQIRIPFSAMDGVGLNAAKQLAASRDGGEYSSRDDLQVRSGVTKAVIAALEAAGALEGMPQSEQISFI